MYLHMPKYKSFQKINKFRYFKFIVYSLVTFIGLFDNLRSAYSSTFSHIVIVLLFRRSVLLETHLSLSGAYSLFYRICVNLIEPYHTEW